MFFWYFVSIFVENVSVHKLKKKIKNLGVKIKTGWLIIRNCLNLTKPWNNTDFYVMFYVYLNF